VVSHSGCGFIVKKIQLEIIKFLKISNILCLKNKDIQGYTGKTSIAPELDHSPRVEEEGKPGTSRMELATCQVSTPATRWHHRRICWEERFLADISFDEE
jgi:hypothetical protein